MADIPGWAWITVGTFVVASSIWVGTLQFFVWIGSGFIAWGAFKLACNYAVPPEKPHIKPWEKKGNSPTSAHPLIAQPSTPTLHPTPPYYQSHQQPHGQQTRQKHAPYQLRTSTTNCPRCHVTVWSTSNYCHACGARLG